MKTAKQIKKEARERFDKLHDSYFSYSLQLHHAYISGEAFAGEKETIKKNLNDLEKDIKQFLDKIIDTTIKNNEKRFNFWKEDIKHGFIPKCSCGKIATMQITKGKHAEEDNHRPCNWGYFCNKCSDKNREIEEDAMYG